MDWFKLHDEFLNDPKLRRYFSKQERCDWVGLLCLANKAKNRGTVALPDEEISYALELTDDEWGQFKAKLISRRMISDDDGIITILNWTARQYDKPSSTPAAVAERVARSRANKTVLQGDTPPVETPPLPTVTPCNTHVTPCNTLEEIREEEKRRERETRAGEDDGTGEEIGENVADATTSITDDPPFEDETGLQPTEPVEAVKARGRGSKLDTRIPPDFKPFHVDTQLVQRECPNLDIEEATRKWRLYYETAPDSKGIRREWRLVWLESMRDTNRRGLCQKVTPGIGSNRLPELKPLPFTGVPPPPNWRVKRPRPEDTDGSNPSPEILN